MQCKDLQVGDLFLMSAVTPLCFLIIAVASSLVTATHLSQYKFLFRKNSTSLENIYAPVAYNPTGDKTEKVQQFFPDFYLKIDNKLSIVCNICGFVKPRSKASCFYQFFDKLLLDVFCNHSTLNCHCIFGQWCLLHFFLSVPSSMQQMGYDL